MKILSPTTTSPAERQARSSVCALVVMAKAPRPGAVKTRLSPPLTPVQAAALNICFLRDTTQHLAAIAQDYGRSAGLISYTPVGQEHLFEGLLPEDFALVAQRGEAFGERLLAAAEDILACGYSNVCLIDSDSPTVPETAFTQAIEELERTGDRIVLGPSADGGYYLIGMKRAHPEVFEQITWSTGTVAAETRQRALTAGIEVVDLPMWYDVDDGATLAILRAELLRSIPPGFATTPGYPAPHTRNFLLNLDVSLNATTGTPAEPIAIPLRREVSPEGDN